MAVDKLFPLYDKNNDFFSFDLFNDKLRNYSEEELT